MFGSTVVPLQKNLTERVKSYRNNRSGKETPQRQYKDECVS